MIEMDKTWDARLGASRFSTKQIKQSAASGHNTNNKKKKLFSGLNCVVGAGFLSLEKSKRERIKKLTAVHRASSSLYEETSEVGSDMSDREEEGLPSTTSKRFKLPTKFYDDGNGVHQSSVPRKLRSAMKKRNRESISPPFPDSKKLDSNKISHVTTAGDESLNRVVVKKSKLNVRQGGPDRSQGQSVSGPITKDEEEVAETLYALAGMFPGNESDDKSKMDASALNASHSALPMAGESPALHDSVANNENLDSISYLGTGEPADPASNVERSTEGKAKVDSSSVLNRQKGADLSSRKNLPGEVDNSAVQVNPPAVMAEKEERKPLCNSVNFHIPPPELYKDAGNLKQSTRRETRLPDRKPINLEASQLDRKGKFSWGLTTKVGSQLDQQHMINESKKNAPPLWPGLSSVVPSSAYGYGPSLQYSSPKFPACLDTPSCAPWPSLLQSDSLNGKVSIVNDRRSWKRSAAHVHICRLIQALQMPEKDSVLQHQNQLKPLEILKQGVLMSMNDFNGIRNGLNGVASSGSVVAKTQKNPNDAVCHQQRLQQDLPRASLASGGFNFFSLSAGGGRGEVGNCYKEAGSVLESIPQLQVPTSSSQVQHVAFMHPSMSQTHFGASAYLDNSSVATVAATVARQMQHSSHLSGPFNGLHTSSIASTRQQQQQHQLLQQQQQQQQQQRLWAAQLTAQYRPSRSSAPMTQYPIWQQGRQDIPALVPLAQSNIPFSSSSPEVLGPRCVQIAGQHQQLTNITSSLPHSRVKKPDHHLSSVLEDNGGRFLAAGALPLQLLCNDRL